jgi:hypothetical protein
MQPGQNISQFGAVLRPNPVQLKPIGHEQSDFGQVVCNLSREGFDPRIELLLWDFLSQLIETNLPESLACIVCIGGVLAGAHWTAPNLWTD